jgi:hypothetical protein
MVKDDAKLKLSTYLESSSLRRSFRIAVSTVNRSACVRLEWNFTVFSTVSADCLMHFFLVQRLYQLLGMRLCKNRFLHAAIRYAPRLINIEPDKPQLPAFSAPFFQDTSKNGLNNYFVSFSSRRERRNESRNEFLHQQKSECCISNSS